MSVEQVTNIVQGLELGTLVRQVEGVDFEFLLNDNGIGVNVTKVAQYLTATRQRALENQDALDVFFVLVSGYLVFLMQSGFAMLTAGSVRSKNTKNVLLKNVLDACVGALGYWLFGYSFAYGQFSRAPGFIGSGRFALTGNFGELLDFSNGPVDDDDRPQQFHDFFFQWAFAATAATIVSGSVAERTSFYAYLAYAFFLSSFVYPVVSHWVWGGGFLSTLVSDGRGMIDFAGCAVVHMVGGIAGLVGAIIVGPRLGRFDSEGKVVPIPGHSATLVTLGTFILWFGWYGFNPGSALALNGGGANVAERCAVTTTIAAATGGVVTLVVVKLRDHIFDLIATLNGILAGLVSITASCAFVHPYAAFIIGGIGALVYIGAAMLLLKLKIDDPLEAFPIHGAGGFWGVIAVGLFNVREFQGIAGSDSEIWGAFYGGGGQLLGINLAGALIIAMWTAVLIGTLFALMKVAGILRISAEEEIIGNDVSKHGGAAYPVDAAVAAEKAAQADMDTLGMDDSLRTPSSPSQV